MDKKASSSHDPEIRKGPWTMEEDLILINYIANHGEGVWNTLARSAGLKRTGKSCRLRWLNYLSPDVRRGNITPEEQLVIMELHATWGNRWSKIARQLPGRTDSEIKSYWRTRIQKKISKNDQPVKYQNNPTPASEDSTSQMIGMGNSTSTSPPVCSTSAKYPNMFLAPPSSVNEATDGFWTMDDLWSTQLFNSDPMN